MWRFPALWRLGVEPSYTLAKASVFPLHHLPGGIYHLVLLFGQHVDSPQRYCSIVSRATCCPTASTISRVEDLLNSFDALQTLLDGAFHELCDELLPRVDSRY
jgi:hypothetical protein